MLCYFLTQLLEVNIWLALTAAYYNNILSSKKVDHQTHASNFVKS